MMPGAPRGCPLHSGRPRPGCGPARLTVGHAEGTAGEDDVCRSVAAMVTSSGDGQGWFSVTTSLVGKSSEEGAAAVDASLHGKAAWHGTGLGAWRLDRSRVVVAALDGWPVVALSVGARDARWGNLVRDRLLWLVRCGRSPALSARAVALRRARLRSSVRAGDAWPEVVGATQRRATALVMRSGCGAGRSEGVEKGLPAPSTAWG
jgi:hypothetical protein